MPVAFSCSYLCRRQQDSVVLGRSNSSGSINKLKTRFFNFNHCYNPKVYRYNLSCARFQRFFSPKSHPWLSPAMTAQSHIKGGGNHSRFRGRDRDSPRVRFSKTLSWILRHGAMSEGIPMRPDGFVKVEDIVGIALSLSPWVTC